MLLHASYDKLLLRLARSTSKEKAKILAYHPASCSRAQGFMYKGKQHYAKHYLGKGRFAAEKVKRRQTLFHRPIAQMPCLRC